MSDLATRLRVILAEQDMTVRQLAGYVEISYSQLQRYATGKAKPNPENLKLLADRLDGSRARARHLRGRWKDDRCTDYCSASVLVKCR